jgi:tRNA_anti-like
MPTSTPPRDLPVSIASQYPRVLIGQIVLLVALTSSTAIAQIGALGPYSVQALMDRYDQDKRQADADLKDRLVAVTDVIDEINSSRQITLRVRSRDKDYVRCEFDRDFPVGTFKVGDTGAVAGLLKGRGLRGNITLVQCTANLIRSNPLRRYLLRQGLRPPSIAARNTVSSAMSVPVGATRPEHGEDRVVSVAELMAAYERDESDADRQFKNVRLQVRDSIREFGNLSLALGLPGKEKDVVKCPLSPSDAKAWSHLTSGMVVTIQGYGKGRGILGNVTLDECHVLDAPHPQVPRAEISTASTDQSISSASPSPSAGDPTSNTSVSIVATLAVCVLLWATIRLLRRHCPKCTSTKYTQVDHIEIDRSIGTKTVSSTTTANHHTRSDQGQSFKHTGQTKSVTTHEIPVTKVKYRDVFQCKVCEKQWDEVVTTASVVAAVTPLRRL